MTIVKPVKNALLPLHSSDSFVLKLNSHNLFSNLFSKTVFPVVWGSHHLKSYGRRQRQVKEVAPCGAHICCRDVLLSVSSHSLCILCHVWNFCTHLIQSSLRAGIKSSRCSEKLGDVNRWNRQECQAKATSCFALISQSVSPYKLTINAPALQCAASLPMPLSKV